jgi:hypothetical protein
MFDITASHALDSIGRRGLRGLPDQAVGILQQPMFLHYATGRERILMGAGSAIRAHFVLYLFGIGRCPRLRRCDTRVHAPCARGGQDADLV